jgi:hypothetical protein
VASPRFGGAFLLPGERFPRETSSALTFCDPGTPEERMRYAQLSRKDVRDPGNPARRAFDPM